MEKEIKNEEKKEEVKQESQPERKIIITLKGNNITIERNETASVFELQAILENILRKLTIQ